MRSVYLYHTGAGFLNSSIPIPVIPVTHSLEIDQAIVVYTQSLQLAAMCHRIKCWTCTPPYAFLQIAVHRSQVLEENVP
jgi:hypothetical protein